MHGSTQRGNHLLHSDWAKMTGCAFMYTQAVLGVLVLRGQGCDQGLSRRGAGWENGGLLQGSGTKTLSSLGRNEKLHNMRVWDPSLELRCVSVGRFYKTPETLCLQKSFKGYIGVTVWTFKTATNSCVFKVGYPPRVLCIFMCTNRTSLRFTCLWSGMPSVAPEV